MSKLGMHASRDELCFFCRARAITLLLVMTPISVTFNGGSGDPKETSILATEVFLIFYSNVKKQYTLLELVDVDGE